MLHNILENVKFKVQSTRRNSKDNFKLFKDSFTLCVSNASEHVFLKRQVLNIISYYYALLLLNLNKEARDQVKFNNR